jgi:peptidoglycan/xylan/chitin deacetylase (PgdA/CDA1 family)
VKATLTYHSIDESGSPISLSPTAFEAHAQWLASGDVKVLSLDALMAHPVDGEDAVAVTFDDGFLSTRGPVEQLLGAGVPATLFIVSGHVGTTNAWNGRAQTGIPVLPLMSWDHVEYLVARGATIGAHTRTHRVLTKLPSGVLEAELVGSWEDLHGKLGVRAVHIAYPFGAINPEVTRRAAGYFRWGHTTDFRVMAGDDEPMEQPRLDMYYFSDPGALASWGTPAFMRRVAWCRARRRLRAGLLAPLSWWSGKDTTA